MIYDDANDIVDKRFKALLSRYENNLETTKIGSHFFFSFSPSFVLQMSQNEFWW